MNHRRCCVLFAGLAVVFSACAAAVAGEPRIVGPARIVPGDLAIFRIEDAPPGGVWAVWPEEAQGHFLPVQLPDGKSAAVFAARERLKLVVIYAASTANEATPVLLLHSCLNGEGSDPLPPDPDPDPSPSPPEKRACNFVVIEESSRRTPELARLIAHEALRKTLRERGHTLYVYDRDVVDAEGKVPDYLAGYLRAAEGKPLPVLVCTTRDAEKTELLFAEPLDGTLDGFVTLVRRVDPEFPQIDEPEARRIPNTRILVPRCSSGTCYVR